MSGAIVEEGQQIHAWLPSLPHAEECCLADFGVVGLDFCHYQMYTRKFISI
jgi:hypothetical protein